MNPYFPSHENDSFAGVANASLLQALALRAPGGALAQAAAQAGMTQQGLYDASQLAAATRVEQKRGDDVMYGLDSFGQLPAGCVPGIVTTILVTPQKRHVPQRIIISENMANNFVVHDLRAGVEPILIVNGVISAAVFVQNSTTPPFRSVVMEVGNTFSINVENISGALARFTATVLGKYLPAGI